MDRLVRGDTIVEYTGSRAFKYKVSGVQAAACSAFKTHVQIGDPTQGFRHWCYDSGTEVSVI